jgi:aspartyl-tRNA synthetase
VVITPENVQTWPKESPLTATMGLELNAEGAVVNNGEAVPGDIIWLAQRKKIAEVSKPNVLAGFSDRVR